MQGTPLAVDENHQNSDPEEDQAERETQCPKHSTPGIDAATVLVDDLQSDE